MDLIILGARVLLAAVFAVSGVAKLLDRAGTRKAAADFGAPAWLAAPLAVLLPAAELAVATALLPLGSAWYGAAAGAALLLLFSAAIISSLLRGKSPDCHCFGQLYSQIAGWWTVARNVALLAIAGYVLAQDRSAPGASAVAWLGDLSGAERLALGVAAGALAVGVLALWLLLQLVQQNGRLLERLDQLETQTLAAIAMATRPGAAPLPPAPQSAEPAPPQGLPVGSVAPAVQLTGLQGETLTLEALRSAGRPLLLIFTNPGCGACTALMPDVARWQRELSTSVTLLLISMGSVEDTRATAVEHGLTRVLLQEGWAVSNAYQAHSTPSAVLVLPDGMIGSPVAPGAEQIRALVARIAGTPVPPTPNGTVPPPDGDALGGAPDRGGNDRLAPGRG